MSRPDKNRSESFVQVREATNDIYSSSEEAPALDRVYHAKATLLNNAVQEIGVGKYQVRPRLYSPTNLANQSPTAVALRCRWPRMVRGQPVACKYAIPQR